MVDQLLPALKHDLKEGGISLDNIFVELLDLHRNSGLQYRVDLLTILKHKLNEREPDLIIAVNQGAVDFVARDAKDLFPGVPMLIPILEKYPEWEGEPRELITLTTRQDAEGTLGYALELFPETKRTVIIMGKDDHQAPFVEAVRAVLGAVQNGLTVETTADLTYEEMLERISELSPNTIAFYGSYFHDITGRSFVPAEVARKVGETANVPVFAFRDMHITSGLAGGSVAITADMGRLAAEISLEYLDGKLVLEEPVTNFYVPNFPLFDWMQIKQMGGDISTLPGNTIFLNRPLTIWEQYKEIVIIVAISFVLLFLMSIALAFRTRQQKKLIVKLNKAEITLHENEALLARSQEIAHVGTWVLDLATNKLYWSDEVYRIFGFDPQEFTATYEAFLGFVHPGDREAVDEAYSNSLREGTDNYEIEHRIVRKDTGEVRHVFERCVHERDDTGAITQSTGMVQDITKRKRTEENIRISAERARIQRDLIAQLTFDDTVVNGNIDEALKIVTTKVAAILKVDRVSVWLLSEDDTKLQLQILFDAASGVHSQIITLNAAGIPSYFEALRNDSQVDADDAQNDPRTKEFIDHYFIPLQISSLLDSSIQQDGRLIGVFSAEHRGPVRQWHDDEKSFLSAVTNMVAQLFTNAERKQAEEKLKLLRRAVEASSVSVIITDSEGTINFVNPYFIESTGYSYDEVMGNNPRILNSGKQSKAFYQDLWQTIKFGKDWTGNFQNRKKNGELYWEKAIISPILNSVTGEITHFVAIKEDITELLKKEDELKQSLKEKEIMLAEIHHRVKNNLAVVSAMLQIQSMDEENSEVLNRLSVSTTRIKAIANIHEQLYQCESFSSIAFSKNIRKLTQELIKTFNYGKKIKLDLSLEQVHLNVNQAVPCSLIVNEVIINALKHAFIEEKGGNICVNLSENDNQVQVKITDNGIGLPDDFMQDSNSGGMMIVQVLTDQLNGEYSYKNIKPGVEFSLTFEKSDAKGSTNSLF